MKLVNIVESFRNLIWKLPHKKKERLTNFILNVFFVGSCANRKAHLYKFYFGKP